MAKTIALNSYEKTVHIPFGKTTDIGTIDLNSEVEVTIKGKIKAIRAETPAGTEYKDQKFRPATMEIDMESVTMGDKTNIFTRMTHAEDKESGLVRDD